MASKPAKDPDGTFTPRELRRLAIFQKLLMVYGYLYIALAVYVFFLSGLLPIPFQSIPLIAFYLGPLAIAGVAFRIHPPVQAALLAFFSLTPVVCLAIFVLVIQQTSEIFKKHGVATGLWFGAKMSSIDALDAEQKAAVTADSAAAP